MLPSSPPQMATRSRPETPADYSLDLDALMPDEGSELNTPAPKADFDVVRSEDIDGPTDFTQNMDYWMSAKLPAASRHTQLPQQARDDLQDFVDSKAIAKLESARIGSFSMTGAPNGDGDHRDVSLLSNIPSSPRSEGAHDSTPKTVEHIPTSIRYHEASVEDHEETPVRAVSGRESSSAIGATLRSPEFTLKEKASFHGEHRTIDESPVQLKAKLKELEHELDGVKARCEREFQDMQRHYASMMEKQKLSHEKEVQQHQQDHDSLILEMKAEIERALAADHAAQLAEVQAEMRENLQSIQMTDHAEEMRVLKARLAEESSRAGNLQARLSEQLHSLQAVEGHAGSLQQKLEASERMEAELVAKLATERNGREDSDSNMDSRYLEVEQLAKAANHQVKALEAEVAHLKLSHASEIDELVSRVESAADSTERAVSEQQQASQNALCQANAELIAMHKELDARDNEVDSLQETLQRLRETVDMSAKESATATNKLKEQKALNDQAAKEILSLRSAQKSLQGRVDMAESALASTKACLQAMEDELSAANETRLDADDEVDRAKAEAAQARKDAELAKAELLVLREDYKLVNGALDKQIREMMRAREAEWMRRLGLLEEELGLRGRVLMKEWGVKEMGGAEPQSYRYKYV